MADDSSVIGPNGLSLMQTAALGLDPQLEDFDGDGMDDKWEFENGLNPLFADATLDSDGDGITNAMELKLGLDPNSSDQGISYIPLGQGWNMVSVPTTLNGTLVGDVFPQAQSTIWSWDTSKAGYEVADELAAVDTKGYWIYASEESLARMDGKGSLTVKQPVVDVSVQAGSGLQTIDLSAVFDYTGTSSIHVEMVSSTSATIITSATVIGDTFSYTPNTIGSSSIIIKASVDGFEVFDEFVIEVK